MNSLYLYPWDAADGGIGAVIERIADAGITAVKVACVYHAGKILLTNNPARHVFFPEDGAAYFRPRASLRYESALQPPVSSLCTGRDLLDDICAEAAKRGVAVDAWVVCMHNRSIAAERPEVCTENAYGDRYPHSLCPMQPEVRRYIAALVRELARRPIRRVVLEAIGFVPFRHYSYVQVEGVETGNWEDLLLSLCFCDACRRGLPGAEALRSAVRSELDEFLSTGRPREVERNTTAMLNDLLDARAVAVSELVQGLSQAAAAAGKSISVIASGDPRDPLTGIDLAQIGPAVDAIDFAYYKPDSDALESQLKAVAACVPVSCSVDLLLRPGYPDASSAADIRQKLEVARNAGVTDFSFYNYGLLSADAFEWMRQAIGTSTPA